MPTSAHLIKKKNLEAYLVTFSTFLGTKLIVDLVIPGYPYIDFDKHI
jgi:hypothetical protein